MKPSPKILLSMGICFCVFWGAPAIIFAFSDVPQDSFFFIPADFLKKQGLVQGYEDGTFHPERQVQRAEALAMILKATKVDLDASEGHVKNIEQGGQFKITLPKNTDLTIENTNTGEKTVMNNVEHLKISSGNGTATLELSAAALNADKNEKPFRDVSKRDWFYGIVKESKRMGLIHGDQKGEYFRPARPVNLAETLRMLFKISKINTELTNAPLPPGIQENNWFAKDIAYAVSRTLITQQENGSIFPPGKELTRGELTVLLYRFIKTRGDAQLQFGYASWYGDGLAKTKLTSGIEYADRNLTAAHKTLPFGSIVRATNMANGKYVDVVINDRGPFVAGRIIDLSKTAFGALESTSAGIMSVQIEVKK